MGQFRAAAFLRPSLPDSDEKREISGVAGERHGYDAIGVTHE